MKLIKIKLNVIANLKCYKNKTNKKIQNYNNLGLDALKSKQTSVRYSQYSSLVHDYRMIIFNQNLESELSFL